MLNVITTRFGLEDEAKKYFEAHPEVAEQILRAEKAYRDFGRYINLTQSRVIIRESGASNAEGDLSAALSRANC